MFTAKVYLATGLFIYSSVSAYTWPSETDLLESIYYQQIGYGGRNFGTLVRTCSEGANLEPGRTDAAEWIRTAYHDMATADVDAGTGGLDASIGFERDRPENVGRAIRDTLLIFIDFMSIRSSMADLIALGAVMSVSACTVSETRKPTFLRFRGGRVDATGPGPSGVPEPHQDLVTHTERFRKQGFNQSEMIALVACGHSIGGVNGRDFPEIVPVKEDPANVESKQNFDSTKARLDNSVAVQFLANNTQNALAFGTNETTRSDHRIFTADGGAMMRQLASSNDVFLDTCIPLLERMLDTVPKNVTLSAPIEAIAVKPDNIFISVNENGNMTITGDIRIRTDNRTRSSNRQVLLHFKPRATDAPVILVVTATRIVKAGDPNESRGLYPFSPQFEWWSFTVTVPATQGFSSFTVDVVESGVLDSYTNGGSGFPLEMDLIPQADMSCGANFMGKAYLLNLTVAVRDDARFDEVRLSVPIPAAQEGSMVYTFDTKVTTMRKARSLEGTGYSFYTASVDERPQQMFVSILSYGLSGLGGVKNVDVPFTLWKGLGSCPFPSD